MVIKVYGPGCPKCEQAEAAVRAAVARAAVNADVQKITDFQEIAQDGVFSTPAVSVDGEVKASGRAPSEDEVLSWIS